MSFVTFCRRLVGQVSRWFDTVPRFERDTVILSCIQRWVATSTAEAEFLELFRTAYEIEYLHGLLRDFRLPVHTSVVYVDSQPALDIVKGDMVHRRSKHMSAKVARVGDMVTHGTVEFLKVPSAYNAADMFTKQLPRPSYASAVDTVYDIERFLRRPVGACGDSIVNDTVRSPLSDVDKNRPVDVTPMPSGPHVTPQVCDEHVRQLVM